MKKTNKRAYVSPKIEVLTFLPEHGFAITGDGAYQESLPEELI